MNMEDVKKPNRTGPDANKIGVRLEVKRKFERVARRQGWTLAETASRAVVALEQSLRAPSQPAPTAA